ncbi:MAG: hypothetical protein ACRDIZ_08195 [Actinomycetota bacterium]
MIIRRSRVNASILAGKLRTAILWPLGGGPAGSGKWSRSHTRDADTGRRVAQRSPPRPGHRQVCRSGLRRQASILEDVLDGGEFCVGPLDVLPTIDDVGRV